MNKLVFVLLFVSLSSFSGQDVIKKAFSFGALPTVLYSSDVGFQYGALVNFFWYGDGGERYPHFDNSLYVEFSRTTRGNQVLQAIWDARRLISDARLLVDFQVFISQANPFYGFNGYQSLYDSDFEDSDSPDYISELYYRFDMRSTRFRIDFQKNLQGRRLRMLAGLTVRDVSAGGVDIDHLNDGRGDDEKYPDVPGLYENYVDWGVISPGLAEGGIHALIRAGIVLDTRDIEANPSRGVFEEASLTFGPSFLGFDDTVLRLDLIHRHYMTLLKDRLTFAYRLKYETGLAGAMPWYLMEGVGGGKTVRGLLYNRLQGDGLAFGNFEFRWKVFKTVLWNQNLYIALNPFVDLGRVTTPYDIDFSGVPDEARESLEHADESWHIGYGMGARLVLNENFVMAVDYGMAADEKDGTSGIYIDLNYLF